MIRRFDFDEPLTFFSGMKVVCCHRLATFLFWKVRRLLKIATDHPYFIKEKIFNSKNLRTYSQNMELLFKLINLN